MLNKVVIQGRMTRDAEVRAMPNGKSTTAFSIACDRDYKNDDGSAVCDFVDCVAFDRTADFIGKYFTKGRMILIEGRLQRRRFTAKDGMARNVTEIFVEKAFFCDTKSGEKSEARKEEPQVIKTPELESLESISPDDIPF